MAWTWTRWPRVVWLEALHPSRAPFGRLQGGRVVGGLLDDLAGAEVKDVDCLPYAAIGVSDRGLGRVVVASTSDPEHRPARCGDPPVLAAGDPSHFVRRRARVVLVHLPVVGCATNTLARLRHLPDVVSVEEFLDGVQITSVQGLEKGINDLAIARSHRWHCRVAWVAAIQVVPSLAPSGSSLGAASARNPFHLMRS